MEKQSTLAKAKEEYIVSDFENAAKVTNINREHDSLATEYSILQNDDGVFQENQPFYWRFFGPFFLFFQELFRHILQDFQTHYEVTDDNRKSDPYRREKGPRWLNVLLGKYVHPMAETVREGVTTSEALDFFYSANPYFREWFGGIWKHPKRFKHIIGGAALWCIANFMDPQAARNRLRLTYRTILDELQRLHEEGEKDIRMLSLACGSAEASIYALARFLKENPDAHATLDLVDLSEGSLQRADFLAQELGVADSVTTHLVHVGRFVAVAKRRGLKWHSIENVGQLDYAEDEKCKKYIANALSVLTPSGLYVAALIGPSPDHENTEFLIGWPGLIRRMLAAVQQLVAKIEGFSGSFTVESEACGIHHMIYYRNAE